MGPTGLVKAGQLRPVASINILHVRQGQHLLCFIVKAACEHHGSVESKGHGEPLEAAR